MAETGDEPLIVEARYHAASERVFIDLSNGAIIAFPADAVTALAGASAEGLAQVQIVDDGHVLAWPTLGVHLSYLAILTDVLGTRAHITRISGSVIDRLKDRAERAAAGESSGRRKRPKR